MVPRRDAQARERLASLAPGITSGVLAGERSVPVVPSLRDLLPNGLTRGSVVGCRGDAALSSAYLLAAAPSQVGMWVGVAGVPCLGVQACREAGVALERVVVVHETVPPAGGSGRSDEQWGHVLASLIDGFDIVLFGAAHRLRAATARRVQTRLQTRGAVMLLVGAPGALSCDVQVTTCSTWQGLEEGHGHLRARRLDLAIDGRRVPRTRRGAIWFPTASGEIEPVAAERVSHTVDAHDAQDAVALGRTG